MTGTLLCRLFGHIWMVRGTMFDWNSPMHERYCARCGYCELVMG